MKSTVVAVALIMSVQALHSQAICFDPEACNFGSPAIECTYGNWFRTTNGQPAVYDCLGVISSGWVVSNQECMIEVINSDPFCVENMWDGPCQAAYLECCPSETLFVPNLLLPGMTGLRPIVACSDSNIEGYLPTTSSSCVIYTYQDCYFTSWDSFCAEEQFLCDYGCSQPQWYIPVGPSAEGFVAVFDCSVPNGPYMSVDQECVAQLIDFDPFCSEASWDDICIQNLSICTDGCTYNQACNYSPSASRDNGSCIFPGCTDNEAINFDPIAGCDDGLCVFPIGSACQGDLNNDGSVNVSDLTIFLSVYGTLCD